MAILIFFVQLTTDDLAIVYEVLGYDESSTERQSRETSIERQLCECCERIKWLELENASFKNSYIAKLEEKDGQIQKEKEATNKIIKELQEKLYKIGQSKQIIFLNKQKEFRDYCLKDGLGFKNPYVFNKVYGKRPSLYSYEVQQIIDKYLEFGIRDMLSLTDADK